ncbi:hypothetical protein D3C84_528340 [compost metagenome]
MLFGGAGDLHVHVVDHGDRVADLAQRRHRLANLLDTALGLTMAVVHRTHHLLGAVLQLFDHQTGFFHGLLGTPRQVAHFIGHHGKPAPGLTGTGRFDRGVEGQQVGLLGNRTDYFQHRADLLAVGRQTFDLNHGRAHVGGEVVDAGGGAVDHGQALTGRLIGIAGGVCRLRGAAGDVLGGGAHFVGGGRHLVHLTVLLFHAGAGLCGDGGRLVSRTAGVLHRAFHFGNDRLQLVEETVEPAGQLAQFILLVVGQAAGQVTFAAGDVFEHVRHAEDRSGDAAGHQPHQQQAEQRGEHPQAELDQGTGGVAVIELLFQGFGGADQDFLRHVEQHAPGFTVGNRLEGCQHFQLLMAVQAGGFAAGGEHAQQFGAIGLIHGVQALAEFAGVRAVAGEQAGRADDADAGLAVIELLARAQADRLQAVEVDVHG